MRRPALLMIISWKTFLRVESLKFLINCTYFDNLVSSVDYRITTNPEKLSWQIFTHRAMSILIELK